MLFDNLRPFWQGEESLQEAIQSVMDRRYLVVLSALYPNIEERPTDFQFQIGIKHFLVKPIDEILEKYIKVPILTKFPFVSFIGEPVKEKSNDPDIIVEFGFKIRVGFNRITEFYLPETYRLASLLLTGAAETMTEEGAFVTMREMENFLIETGRKKLNNDEHS